jgi:hypothetical protein
MGYATRFFRPRKMDKVELRGCEKKPAQDVVGATGLGATTGPLDLQWVAHVAEQRPVSPRIVGQKPCIVYCV